MLRPISCSCLRGHAQATAADDVFTIHVGRIGDDDSLFFPALLAYTEARTVVGDFPKNSQIRNDRDGYLIVERCGTDRGSRLQPSLRLP